MRSTIYALLLLASCANPETARKQKVDQTQNQLTYMALSLETFEMRYKRYPERLRDLVERPSYVPEDPWDSGTVESSLKLLAPNERWDCDAWNREFLYRSDPAGASYELLSLGEDGVEGGAGFGADLRTASKK